MSGTGRQGWRKLHYWRNTSATAITGLVLRDRYLPADPVDRIEITWERGYGWKYCEWTKEDA